MQVKSLVLVTSLALQCPTLLSPLLTRFHEGSKALFLPPQAHAVLHSAALALGHLTASLASYLVGVRRRAVPRGHPLTKGDSSGVLVPQPSPWAVHIWGQPNPRHCLIYVKDLDLTPSQVPSSSRSTSVETRKVDPRKSCPRSHS